MAGTIHIEALVINMEFVCNLIIFYAWQKHIYQKLEGPGNNLVQMCPRTDTVKFTSQQEVFHSYILFE